MNELVMCIVTQNIVPNTVELDWPSVTSFWGLTVATGRQNKTWQHAESGYQTAGFGTVVRCHFAARRVLKRVFENENKNDNEKKNEVRRSICQSFFCSYPYATRWASACFDLGSRRISKGR